MCERKTAAIQRVLSQVFSTDVNVLIQSDEGSKPSPPSETPVTVEPSPQVNREQRTEALNDPAVQMVLKGLNATPVDIQKVRIEADVVDETREEEN